MLIRRYNDNWDWGMLLKKAWHTITDEPYLDENGNDINICYGMAIVEAMKKKLVSKIVVDEIFADVPIKIP